MMWAKFLAPGFVKIKVFWNKVQGVIIFALTSLAIFYHVTQIIF